MQGDLFSTTGPSKTWQLAGHFSADEVGRRHCPIAQEPARVGQMFYYKLANRLAVCVAFLS